LSGGACFFKRRPFVPTTRLGSLLAVGHSFGALIYHYELDGSLADSPGGPSLVASGGTQTPTEFSFGMNEGFILSNALPNPAEYSIHACPPLTLAATMACPTKSPARSTVSLRPFTPRTPIPVLTVSGAPRAKAIGCQQSPPAWQFSSKPPFLDSMNNNKSEMTKEI
jgi:hypothetical protein